MFLSAEQPAGNRYSMTGIREWGLFLSRSLPLAVLYRVAAFFLIGGYFLSSSVQAQENFLKLSFANPPKDPVPISLLTGQSRLIIFNEAYGRIAVPGQDIAESVPVDDDQILITGKAPGQSTVVVWAKGGSKFIFFDVAVRVNLTQLDAQIRMLLPNEDIQLSQNNGSVVLSGKVSKVQVLQQADTIAQSFGFKTVNLLKTPVANEQQVQLMVRVAEVNRNKIRELAASPAYQSRPGTGAYSNTGSGPWTLNQVDAGNMFGAVSASALNLFLMNSNAFLFLRALQSQGALRALAEPNLVAMNGQQASFLAGGEIPIPIVQGNAGSNGQGTVSIQYKEYGVRINFKPNIIDEDHIRLELEPEVSTLDYANSVQLNGFRVPALRTRRAKTGIELRDGQSFALAGLLDNNEVQSLAKVPWIGDVPLLGALFKSKQFQKQETELVFFVTAQMTKPVNPDAVPQMRGLDGLKSGSPLEDLPPDPTTRNRTTKSPVKPDPNSAAPQNTPAIETPAAPTLVPQRIPKSPEKATPAIKTSLPKNEVTMGENSSGQAPGSSRARHATTPDLRALEKLVWTVNVPEFKSAAQQTVRREK
ncbi:MAG TPA: pilus assembly protein N-terminal domain-containing protein [Blastocatellia bacterium]|nr:pilus assembly protein N-terminal domain-containing protein [Blastocatellia bacterium]